MSREPKKTGRVLYPVFRRIGDDVYRLDAPGAGWRWYCTLASWPYSPPARAGIQLIE